MKTVFNISTMNAPEVRIFGNEITDGTATITKTAIRTFLKKQKLGQPMQGFIRGRYRFLVEGVKPMRFDVEHRGEGNYSIGCARVTRSQIAEIKRWARSGK